LIGPRGNFNKLLFHLDEKKKEKKNQQATLSWKFHQIYRMQKHKHQLKNFKQKKKKKKKKKKNSLTEECRSRNTNDKKGKNIKQNSF
jgi:hypothetical protein